MNHLNNPTITRVYHKPEINVLVFYLEDDISAASSLEFVGSENNSKANVIDLEIENYKADPSFDLPF